MGDLGFHGFPTGYSDYALTVDVVPSEQLECIESGHNCGPDDPIEVFAPVSGCFVHDTTGGTIIMYSNGAPMLCSNRSYPTLEVRIDHLTSMTSMGDVIAGKRIGFLCTREEATKNLCDLQPGAGTHAAVQIRTKKDYETINSKEINTDNDLRYLLPGLIEK